MITGVVANSGVKSYAGTSVSWPQLANSRCHVAAGKSALPIVVNVD